MPRANPIKKKLLRGEPVHFASGLPEEQRQVRAAWVKEALRRREGGVRRRRNNP